MELSSFVDNVLVKDLPEEAHIPHLVWNLCMLNGIASAHLMQAGQAEIAEVPFDEAIGHELLGGILTHFLPLAIHICKEKGLDITGYLDGWNEKVPVRKHDVLGNLGVSVELCAQTGGALSDLQIGVFDYRKFNKIWDNILQLATLHGVTCAVVADIMLAQELYVGDAKPVTH